MAGGPNRSSPVFETVSRTPKIGSARVPRSLLIWHNGTEEREPPGEDVRDAASD